MWADIIQSIEGLNTTKSQKNLYAHMNNKRKMKKKKKEKSEEG
jgi:hypothetical protein